jgi:putative flippase GtrA
MVQTYSKFYEIPQIIRMLITALIGAFIGFLTYELICWLNPVTLYRATSSWMLSFLIGIARQHGLHRVFTFTHKSPYWRSLGRAYLFYSASAIIGSALNLYLTKILSIHYRLAWLSCLVITALISVLFLEKLVFISQPEAAQNFERYSYNPDH